MKSARDLFAQIVEALVGPRLAVRTICRMTVFAQRADGTLDLNPAPTSATAIAQAGASLPPLTEVPIAYGIPGVRAKVRKGAVVFVEFAEANFADPIVVGWAPGACEELTVDADRVRLADGDMPLARRGDLIAVALPLLVGTTTYSPLGIDPTAKAYGTIISGSAVASSK